MKKIYFFLFFLCSVICYSQTVTTILDDPNADVDDAMALDSQGNLYGSNFAGTNVYKITPDGTVSIFASGLANPNGLAIDSKDNVYVVEYSGGAIHKYDKEGELLETFNVGNFPSGLIKVFNSDNVIYTTADFAAVGSNGIYELNVKDGTSKTLYQGGEVELGVGLAYGQGSQLYVGDYLSRRIYRILRNGKLKYVATVPAPNNSVPFLAFITYSQGYLYGTVYGENKIYKINPRKIDDVEIYAGSTFGDSDGELDEATFAFPAGILADKIGNNLYVSEFSGIGNIRQIGDNPRPDNYQDEDVSGINTFPNPTRRNLQIDIDNIEEEIVTIDIWDVNGKKVKSKEFQIKRNRLQENLSLADLPSGIYHAIIRYGNVKETKTIIKE